MEEINQTNKKNKLAKDDINKLMNVAEMLTNHINKFEIKIAERTERLENHILGLEKEIMSLKKSHYTIT